MKKQQACAIIFGVTGQDSYYMSKMLEQNNIILVEISWSKGDITGDIPDFDFVKAIIIRIKLFLIFNFSANLQHYMMHCLKTMKRLVLVH